MTSPVMPSKRDIWNMFKGSLSPDENSWLNLPSSSATATSLYNYLGDNWSLESHAFAKEALSTLIGGGEVDFENEIILDISILQNTVLDCVFEKLKTLDNSYFKNVIEEILATKRMQKLDL